MTLGIILFRKNQIITYFCPFLFFVCLLLSLTNKWPNNTLSVFEEGANKYILRAEFWFDRFVVTAFSGKFQLKFCLLFFIVLFSRFKK